MSIWDKIYSIILVFICVVVAISFTIPIIIYGADSDRRSSGENHDNATISISKLDPKTCVDANDFQEINDNISISSFYNDQCLEYNGICTEYLSQLNNHGSLFTLIRHGVSEDTITQFILDIIPLGSQKCRTNILPFLCQYIYPPCDITNNDTVNFISQTECSNIRDTVCSFEWNAVKNVPLARDLLPNCESFDGNDTLTIEPQSLQCDHQFKEFCGLCLPLCRKFSQYEDESEFKQNVTIIFAVAAAFIGGLLVFIASIYKWRKMLDFPSVYVLYTTVCAFVIASLVLITYIGGQRELYCSHETLILANDNPPAYCQITGFVFHWTIMLMAAFWVLHALHVFLKIIFPLWSRKLDVKQTKITLHVVEAVGAFILCGLPPIAYISTSKYSFGRFPPLLCVPSKDVFFYTVLVPMCIMMGTGVILTIIMFSMLHKRQQLFVRRDSKYLKYFISFSVPEVKILILSCYFIIFGIIALVNFSVSIRDSDIQEDRLLAYFVCQARGTNNNNTCNEEYDEVQMILSLRETLNNAVYFLMGLLPWLNLLFAIQVRYVKKRVMNCFTR